MAEHPLPYRDLRRILKSFGIEEDSTRGKGSERMFVGIVGGRVLRYPTKCHGEGKVKPAGVIRAIRRVFRPRAEDGVSDKEFYGRA
jgi:hypothetical protein